MNGHGNKVVLSQKSVVPVWFRTGVFLSLIDKWRLEISNLNILFESTCKVMRETHCKYKIYTKVSDGIIVSEGFIP